MIITAIRFKNVVEGELRVWRFEAGKGKFRNIQCFFGTEQNLEDIKAAMIFALSGHKQARIQEAAIQLTDEGGGTWVIDRNQEKTRIFRNSKLLTNETSQTALLSAMLDLDCLQDSQDTGQNDNIFDLYKIDCQPQQPHFSATSLQSDHFSLMKIQNYVSKQTQMLRRQISESMEMPLLAEHEQLTTLAEKLEPLYLAHEELARQKKTMLSNLKNSAGIDPAAVENLAAEISILAEIEQAAKPLLNPGHSPKVLREKLDKIEQDLASGLQACNLSALPVGQDDVAWQQTATVLAKLTIYKKLAEASAKAHTFIQNSVEPIYKNYVQVIEKFLSSDKEITQELEASLTTLHTQLQLSSQKRESRSSLSRFFWRFIRPSTKHDAASSEADNDKHMLDHSRLAVDYVLSRLGELHGSLNLNHKTSLESLDKLKEPEAKIRDELTRLNEKWQLISQKQNIPFDMDLNHLLKLISQYAHLSTLRNEKHRLQQILTERQTHLHRLETALMDWHKTSASQKIPDYSNQPLLIAEAQGVLRYKKMKEEQHQRLKLEMENSKAYQAIRINIEKRQAEVSAVWNKTMQLFELPALSPELPNWPIFFAMCKTLHALTSFKDAQQKPLVGGEIFKGSNFACPISLFQWKETPIKTSEQLAFLNLLEQHSTQNLVVLLITDSGLYEQLKKSEVGFSRPWERKLSAPAQTPARNKSSKPIIHEGARAALDILTSKASP